MHSIATKALKVFFSVFCFLSCRGAPLPGKVSDFHGRFEKHPPTPKSSYSSSTFDNIEYSSSLTEPASALGPSRAISPIFYRPAIHNVSRQDLSTLIRPPNLPALLEGAQAPRPPSLQKLKVIPVEPFWDGMNLRAHIDFHLVLNLCSLFGFTHNKLHSHTILHSLSLTPFPHPFSPQH